MLVDSWYDAYLGVVVMVRVMDGVLRKGDRIRMMQTGAVYPVNAEHRSVRGVRAYPSVRDIPDPVDLAVVAGSCGHALVLVPNVAAERVRAVELAAGETARLSVTVGTDARADLAVEAHRDPLVAGLRVVLPN